MDVFNKYLVSCHTGTGKIIIQGVNRLVGPIHGYDAIVLAAWLVAVAGDLELELFNKAYNQVMEIESHVDSALAIDPAEESEKND